MSLHIIERLGAGLILVATLALLSSATFVARDICTLTMEIGQCLQVYGFIRNFTEINEILRVKSAELRIFKHPAPPLFMHVHSV